MKSIKLTLLPEKSLYMPFAHLEVLQGLFYHLLSYREELSTEIHDKQPGEQKQFKFFCFTDLYGNYKVKNTSLVYLGALDWEIRSADDGIINTIVASVQENPQVTINGQLCRVISYSCSKRFFLTDTAELEMNTPLLYYQTDATGYSTYYAPTDALFLSGVKNNIVRKYTAFYGAPPDCDICFQALGNSIRKCVTHYKKSIITGYYGRFRLTASQKVLDFVYHTGLGAKNSMGFGVVK